MIRRSSDQWQKCAREHRERLLPVVQAHLDRRSAGLPHPILDFLFDYYSFAPAHLLAWSPGPGVVLEGDAARAFLRRPEFGERDGGVALLAERFPRPRLKAARWISTLLKTVARRAPRFGCHALHEWAMVYRATDIRHSSVPLRMTADGVATVVESLPLCCSHFDAFRFFTASARPRNAYELKREAQLEHDQPGCLHANMDLYKWAFKFSPWISADLVSDAFLLAVDIRELDMQASPYELSAYGCAPIRIETPEGREEFTERQRSLAGRAAELRLRLSAAYDRLLSIVDDGSARDVEV